MDVDGPGVILSPGTEDETIARRRSRRVSFAETTAVHVFDRDEDFETPPEERAASPSPSPKRRRSSAEGSEGNDTSDADSPAPPIVFVPEIDSSSPGSAVGSVVSTDDDNFFGPVSTSFIQTGRPSDAGMSEDGTHDITLDSRSFSMYFLDAAIPDDCTANSVGSLRTPDMASKAHVEELNVSEPERMSSRSQGASSDMSMLTCNPRTFNYGKMSPLLSDIMQKIEQEPRRNLPIVDNADVNPDRVSVSTANEEECREDNTCIDNAVSSNELSGFSNTKEHISMRNLASSGSDPIEEDNAIINDCLVKSQENCKHDLRISVLKNRLNAKLQESPAVKRNELSLQANDILRCDKDQTTCNSVTRQEVKKTSDCFTPGAPLGQGPNEFANVQSTSHAVLTLDSQLSRECNSHMDLVGGRNKGVNDSGHILHELPEQTSMAAESPKKSRKQLTSVSEISASVKVFKEKQSKDNDCGQSVNVDWNQVVNTISNATEQVLAASISKLNLQQLITLDDKLDYSQIARKYRRFATAVNVEYCCREHQKRLAEARSLHERLLYRKAKVQITNMKLAELRNKSQQCKIGIQESSFLKCKILGAPQMNNGSLHETSLICDSDGQEKLGVLSEKKLEYIAIQQKLESLRSSLNADSSGQSVLKSAEEQSHIRNQCHVIHQLTGLPKLMDVVKRGNKCEITLNYRNLLFQRIVLSTSDNISSISVSNSLNGTKIGQTFLDLDASVAFNYIFKAEEHQSVSDLQILQKKTMETTLLLGKLVDVLDEIKFAKLMLLNLTSTAFVLESTTCRLALRLCFISFKNGKRIGFTIDMADLNRCVYPSEPSELAIKLCHAQTTISQPIIEETMASVRNLQPGGMLILRLCRMVSQLIQ